MKKPRVQDEVLPHRQLGIEREGLRHVADPAPDPCRSHRPTGRTARACPSVGGSRPVSIFIVVVLPQPLEPRKPKISPRSIRKFTWSTAMKSPNRWVKPCASMATSASPARAAESHSPVPRRFSSGKQRNEGRFPTSCRSAPESPGVPVASTRPASIATSQSNRAASSM